MSASNRSAQNRSAAITYRSRRAPGRQSAGRRAGRFVSLNGTWGITAYESPLDVPDTFFRRKPAGEIPVPACVQFYGYDCFQYTNVAYPIPFDPPYVPEKNPTFHYTRAFEAKKEGRVYLVFEGVDACFYVYVNGKFVGFSQVAHRLSEFDVTPFIRDGSNRLDVIVLKWCARHLLRGPGQTALHGHFPRRVSASAAGKTSQRLPHQDRYRRDGAVHAVRRRRRRHV